VAPGHHTGSSPLNEVPVYFNVYVPYIVGDPVITNVLPPTRQEKSGVYSGNPFNQVQNHPLVFMPGPGTNSKEGAPPPPASNQTGVLKIFTLLFQIK
jgi:hypothetical protein